MAEGRRFALTPQLDIEQILQEARNRWLRPSEVCEILRNYQKFQLTPDPPYKPPGGSLFLFDRKALRYFRKDGHRWRKKKDGKTVREAHEKLKSGSVDVLHCYYAHGEDDENFQRRSYWMLDGKLEHIVLVHYREVNEGSRVGVSHLSNSDTGPQDNARFQTTVTGPTSYVSSPSTVDWSGHAPSSELEDVDSVDAFGASRLADSMSGSGFQITPIAANNARNANFSGCGSSFPLSRVVDSTPGVQSSFFHQFYANQVASQSTTPGGHQIDTESLQQTGFPGLPKSVAFSRSFERANLQNDASMHLWPQIFGNIGIENNNEQRIFSNKPDSIDVANPLLGTSSLVNYGDGDGDGFRLSTDAQPQNARTDDALFQENQKSKNADNVAHHGSKSIVDGSSGICQVPPNEDSYSESRIKVGDQCHVNVFPFHQSSKLAREESDGLNTAPESVLHDENGKLKKLDSFGRWMNKEIGKDCDDSLMASDSGTYWNALDTENDDKEVSSFSRHIQLDTGSLGPSVSQEQFFTILDFSPDWAYSDIETKVLISGTFLGGTELGSIKWGCMFGELEVQAEVLTPNVIRCRAPCHTPGRVPFYITCSNRLACSEIREFEYRKNTHVSSFRLSQTDEKKDEIKFQIRFAKMLTFGVDSEKLVCCLENCSKCSLKKLLHPMLSEDETEWSKAEESKTLMGHENPTEALLQKLLKSRLYDWLIYKAHEVGKGPNVLDKEGQGVIHLAAALGYEWAMGPIVAAGVSPSFRDAHGWTGLHWAACFGREETVVTLVRLGAAPGALEDPTSKVPHGRTAADLASSRGHKGIAGYLAEADLTSHLSSLTVKESVIDSVSANLAAEKAVETVEKQSVPLGGDEGEQLSLRGSLAAVRNSAQAAARIQAAFRIHSFRRRQLVASSEQCMEVPSEAIVFSSKNRTQRTAHPYDPFHLAAVKIQQKYRGWKGRKEFISIRNRIVKIQAHVRGHQVRKQYKKVVWSVGIVEKAILRWRRKGTGLRGFRAEKAQSSDSSGCGKSDEYDFLRLGRKQKVAGIEKALARVQSMVRYPEARDQYMRLVASSQKSKLGGQDMMMPVADKNSEGRKVQEDPLA